MASLDWKLSVLTFPQFWDNAARRLDLRAVVLPRNNPLEPLLTGIPPVPDEPAFVDAQLTFDIRFIASLDSLPDPADVQFSQIGWPVWLAVAYIILVPTAGAYYLNAWALERVAPSTVAVYVYLQPLVAYAAAPFFLGAEEQLTARTFVAAALIFAGVAVVTLRPRGPASADVSDHPDALGH